MTSLTLDHLLQASSAGGSSCLTSTTELRPAGNEFAAVAPARFALPRQDTGTYAFERRFLDGQIRRAVVIDSKQSQLNRCEDAIVHAIDDRHEVLTDLPRVTVTYFREDGRVEEFTDLTLPHRVFDGHIRAGSIGTTPTTQDPIYRAIRDATAANLRPLLENSPVTLVFGGWDASRKARQGRYRSALVGEIIGFCAEQEAGGEAKRGGARVDPVGMKMEVSGQTAIKLANDQRDELSGKLYDKVTREAAKAKASMMSTSALGLGGIPPTLDTLGGVACDRIIRTHVLSFATLRQMRFGAGAAGDPACRALLAALALCALARSDAELFLRANCDLVEASAPSVVLDRRFGEFETVSALGIDEADTLLADALTHAKEKAGVDWHGPTLKVTGNPAIIAGATSDDEGQ